MKPLLHKPCSTILIFCLTLLMISINTPTCLCDDDDQYTNCNAGFSCEGSSIAERLKYPFWGGNRESYCGVYNNPDMQLTCENNNSKITINQVKYRILGWANTTQILKVARDDYWGGDICSVTDNYKNSTFNVPFQLAGDQSAELKLLYNCTATETLPNQFYSITCSADDTTVVYTAADPSRVLCSTDVTVVTIPLLGGYLASQIVSSDTLTAALEDGFELGYTGADFVECTTCVASGGVCGNDEKTGFRCFCRDGAYTTACNLENAPPSSMYLSIISITSFLQHLVKNITRYILV